MILLYYTAVHGKCQLHTNYLLLYICLLYTSGMARGSLRKWATSMPSGDRILRVANFLDFCEIVDYWYFPRGNRQIHLKN